jgi:hypothetical protein
MVGHPVLDPVIGVIAALVFIFGYTQLSLCGSGLSLIFWGLTVLLAGIAVFPRGGPTFLGMTGLLAFMLVVTCTPQVCTG